jgi:hypothetical protein
MRGVHVFRLWRSFPWTVVKKYAMPPRLTHFLQQSHRLEHESKQVKAFFYVQSGNNADRENILSLEKSYFQLRQNSAKKQRTMYDFFVKKLFFLM